MSSVLFIFCSHGDHFVPHLRRQVFITDRDSPHVLLAAPYRTALGAAGLLRSRVVLVKEGAGGGQRFTIRLPGTCVKGKKKIKMSVLNPLPLTDVLMRISA